MGFISENYLNIIAILVVLLILYLFYLGYFMKIVFQKKKFKEVLVVYKQIQCDFKELGTHFSAMS